jgi:hypothetical protein
MGVQREPGQKGVNWSNMAVGTLCCLSRVGAYRSRLCDAQVAS